MVKRISALVLIFLATSVAWMILGGTLAKRTADRQREMANAVGDLWGQPHLQSAPTINLIYKYNKKSCYTDDKTKKQVCSVYEQVDTSQVDPVESGIKVKLGLEQRRKGLLWFSLYTVNFSGDYQIVNPFQQARSAEVIFNFPNRLALYDDLEVKVVEKPDAEIQQARDEERSNRSGMLARFLLNPGEQVTLHYSYRSRGKDEWLYSFGGSVKAVKNFKLTMLTDFDQIDFPANSISPDAKKKIGDGWELTWDKKSLVSGFNIGMVMPKKINPGPLAERMSFFAPVSLLFFLVVIFVLTILRNIKIHPMNYLFLAAAFFSFHLLFAYTVDHINIYPAFAISSVVSIFLVVSYLRLVVGPKFALVQAGGSQFLYLVVFSYAHFFQGYTGLIVTILAIITLFVMMQITGRINWEEKFSAK